MKLLRYFPASIFLLLMLNTSANAALLFTYTSNDLLWQESYSAGYPFDLGGEISPSFTLTFTAPYVDWTQKKSTHFYMENASISVDENHILQNINISSLSTGRVTLDQNGQVTGWNLILFLTEFLAADATPLEKYLHGLVASNIDIVSRYGADTCNCDSLKKKFHPLYYYPRSNTYERLAKQERFYGGDNNPDQWEVSHIEVSEPKTIALLAIGLGSLFLFRRRESTGN